MDAPTTDNPYAPPEAPVGEPPPVASRNVPRALRATRLRHLDDEALVRSVSLFLWMAAAVALVAGPPTLWWSTRASSPVGAFRSWTFGAAAIASSGLFAALAPNLARLRSWARVVALLTTVLAVAVVASMVPEAVRSGSAAGTFGLILGLVPLGLVFYVLGSSDGAFLFSEAYREAVAATPDVRPRTSVLVPLAFIVTAVWAFLATRWNGAP